MRIIGLPKLIREEESEDLCLKNCSLVVDGHSFFYNSYEDSHLPFVFGSEAKEHARYVRINQLLKFRKANVKCYFIFKGGDNNIEEKIEKLKITEFDFGHNYKFVLPVFMREVCQQMLEDSGISYATSVAESKNDCVALAQELDCPILTNNVEHCFKKVPYIMIGTLRYKNPNDYIMCKQFKLQNFLEKHSLTYKKMAIFAALSDIHLFEQGRFDNLLQKLDIFEEDMYERNKIIIKWLSEHNEDEILSNVSDFLSNETENKKFLDQVQHILNNLSRHHWSVVTEYLYNDCRISIKYPDPFWFENGVASQKIAIPYINLYRHQFIQGSTAIEKKTAPDSLMLSMDIILYAYALLTNFKKGFITLYQDADNYIKINTEELKIRRPPYEHPETVFINGWQDLRDLALFEHFLKEIDIDAHVVNRFPVEARMLLISVTYFARKKRVAGVNVTKEVICALVYYSMSHKLRIYELHGRSDQKKHVGAYEFENLQRITEKYLLLDQAEVMAIYDENKLKTLIELQYCILHMSYLNILCGTPYMPIKYHRFFNGTFLYKLLHDVGDNNVYEFIAGLFKTTPTVLSSIKLLVGCYKELLK